MSQESEAGKMEYPRTPSRMKDLMTPEWFNITKPRKKLEPYVDASFESSVIESSVIESSVIKESEGETTDNSFVEITVEKTTDLGQNSDIVMDKENLTLDSQTRSETTPNKSMPPPL